jgi:MFS family permease
MNAIALNSSMFNGARLIGPAVAGILVASIGEGWCFFANCVSYLAVIAGLLMMQLRPWQPPDRIGSTLENVLEGLKYVRRTAPIRALLLLVGLVSLVAMPYTVLMPVFADTILHRGARGLGVLMGATGMGALLGALIVASRQGLRGLGKVTAAAAGGFSVCLILFSLSRWFWLSAAILVPTGMCMMLQMACTNTLIQSMVPERLRGRVMAVYSMMFLGMAPFGALFAGVAAGHLGALMTVRIGAVGSLLGAAIFARHLAGLRAEATRLLLAQGMVAGEPAEEMSTRGITAEE